MRLLHAALIVGLASMPALAEDARSPSADPIDVALDQCLSAPDGESTAGMIACLGTAYQSWDQELNAVYGELIALLEPDQKQALKSAQRQWIAFRDAENAFLASLQGPDSGSALRVTANQVITDFIKTRVNELRVYRDMDR